jgi:DMSO/TMAO reductase YedYZ molybdopterin-dependent catalytic subunit
MKHEPAMKRRAFLKGAMGAASVVGLAGCDTLTQSSWFPGLLNKAETLTELVQRAVTPTAALAKEYGQADISPVFPANGNTDPGTRDYHEKARNDFADWTVMIDGLVATPMAFSLAAIKEMPARTQITRHDCVEGWSAIGLWATCCARCNRCTMPDTRSSIAPTWMTKGWRITRAWRWPIAIIRKRCSPMS